jgi:pyruvate kinase
MVINLHLHQDFSTLDLSNPHNLLHALRTLRQAVHQEGQETFQQWGAHIPRSEFLNSALNLAHYLALRRQDLRPLQAALIPWGLSSLGRIESRVMPNLDAVIATLATICEPGFILHHPPLQAFFEGERLLQRHTEELFGKRLTHRRVRIMVTLPSAAASDYELVRNLLQRGTDCVRINCAHDTVEDWQSMIHFVRQAEVETGQFCKVLMDLAGPKPRTTDVFTPPSRNRVVQGDRIMLMRYSPDTDLSGDESIRENIDNISEVLDNTFITGCTIPEILDQLQPGAAVWIDDGKVGARVLETHHTLHPSIRHGIVLEVLHANPKGVKLRADKGLNFPDTVLQISPLTEKDYRDLDFVAAYADIIGYSFVQRAQDIKLLQQELEKRLSKGRSIPAIVAKIETLEVIRNLPDLIVQAASKQPFGVMIARGDLAVEIGYQRLAEMQEEILWLCEAAHVPVIWATQVLESLVKTGVPSRGEITDAAMAERAECVMLNKGPFIAEAITILDDVLTRMQTHQLKKTPQLRALRSW